MPPSSPEVTSVFSLSYYVLMLYRVIESEQLTNDTTHLTFDTFNEFGIFNRSSQGISDECISLILLILVLSWIIIANTASDKASATKDGQLPHNF
jgi:hypothetical protein